MGWNLGLSKTSAIAMANLMSLTDDQKKSFLDSFDTVITDCDGVLWHNINPIPGAKEVMNILPSINKKRFFFTNNGVRTRKQLVEKFKSLGFDTTEDEILGTAWLTAQYMKNINFTKTVYVIGSEAIRVELNNVGIKNIGVGADPYSISGEFHDDNVALDPDVGAVIVGYDFHFSYPKLLKACSYLSDPDVLFLATNTDERFPLKCNLSIPGAGAFVSALETCTERKAQVMGKPSPLAIDSILVPAGVDPNRCLMIGDRCNTDIQFGNQRGMTTLLVQTGVHQLKDVEQYKASNLNHLVPTYYTSSIADLLKIIKL